MNIDWFTIGAQIVNVLILVILLRLILFKRLLKVMKERKAHIADRFSEIESKKKEADDLHQRYGEKLSGWEKEKETLIKENEKELKAHYDKQFAEQKDTVNELKLQWIRTLEEEKASFLIDLRNHIAKEVISVAGRIFNDLAGTDIEDHIARAFIDKLDGSDIESLLGNGAGQSGGVITIHSRSEIKTGAKREIEKAIAARTHRKPEIVFKTGTEHGYGISAECGGKRLSWNVDDYLDDLLKKIEGLIDENSRSHKTEA
ncbi:MAG: hypothetical protein JW881_15695 [Spirochaetales bacterium]|nr:hypothetical protein [Spirochaetales bacterium]